MDGRPDRVKAAKKSMETFDFLSKFGPEQLNRLFGSTAIFDAELAVVNDMLSILPEKIERMHYLGQSFSL